MKIIQVNKKIHIMNIYFKKGEIMKNSDAVVRISNSVRRLLKSKSAEVDIAMSDLANIFILEGLTLKNDHIQTLLEIQENHAVLEENEDDVEHHLL